MPGYDDDSQELFKQKNILCTMSSTKYYRVIWVKP